MENIDKIAEMVLFNEFKAFSENPNRYFTELTSTGINLIASEYENFSKDKILKQLEFYRLFSQNLSILSVDNLTKIYHKGAKQKHPVFLWLYSKTAILTDLVRAGAIEGQCLNIKTKETYNVLEGIQQHLGLACDFIKGFLKGFNPNSNKHEVSMLIDEIGNSIQSNNRDKFDEPFDLYS